MTQTPPQAAPAPRLTLLAVWLIAVFLNGLWALAYLGWRWWSG